MSGEAPSEPVEAPKPEAPAVADADTAVKTEAPVAAEALPTASKKTERKISRMDEKAKMDRQVMRTKIDEMDRTILDLQSQIDKEKDTGKQAKMRDKLAEDVADREKAYAEYKTMTGDLDAKTEAIREELAQIHALQDEIAGLKAFIEANKATLVKDEILLLADKTRTLDDREGELKKLSPEGHEADLNATLKAYELEQGHIKEEAERRDEIGEADRTLERDMAIALGETPPAEPEPKKPEEEKKPDEQKEEQAPLTKEQKELILDNKIDQIAFDLAKMLAGNVPTENDTIGKFSFEAKRGLLMVMTFLGSDPVWTEQLSADEKDSLGMTVTTKFDEDGKTIHTIKWEPLDLSGKQVKDVYEVAFGEGGWAKEMGELTDKTTVKELQERVAAFPPDTKDPAQIKMKAFVEALVTSGAKPESGVKEYIVQNGDKIIKILKPETATPAAGAAPESEKFNADNLVKIIGEKKLHIGTSTKDVLAAIDPKSATDLDLSEEALAAKAKGVVNAFKSTEELTSYQTFFKKFAEAGTLLGLPDTSAAMDLTFAKAQTELKDGGIIDATKLELQTGIANQIVLVQQFVNTSFYDVLKKQRESATGEDLATIEKLMDALKLNPVPETATAPTK